MSFDVIMIKAFSASGGSHQAVDNPKAKKYVSTSGKALSEAAIKKAKALHDIVGKMGPFEGVYSAESTTSYQTALYATGRVVENDVQEKKEFNQIRLGVFDACEAGAIQEA